jgi:hypothetical protein
MSFLFSIAGTVEVADTGLHISTLGGAAFNSLAALAAVSNTDMDNALADYMAMITFGGGNIMFDFGRLTGLKVAAVDTAGKYLGPPKTRTITTGNAGTLTNGKAQLTEVLTLWSGLTFGTANFGRMYLPYTRLANNGGGAISTTAQTVGLATAGATFIGQINTMANTWVAGAGVVNMSAVGAGTVKAVAFTRSGNVTDTQRRRRRQLVELYDTEPV